MNAECQSLNGFGYRECETISFFVILCSSFVQLALFTCRFIILVPCGMNLMLFSLQKIDDSIYKISDFKFVSDI